MQYNTAIGLILSSAGLIFLVRGLNRFAVICGIFVALIGLATLGQYMFGVDFGIDQLFSDHYATLEIPSAGRMTPPTALSILFGGIAIILLGSKHHERQILSGMFSTFVLSIGIGALLGHVLGTAVPYGWSHLSSMAFETAIGFVALGSGMFAFVLRRAMEGTSEPPGWIPVPVGIILLTALLGLWQAEVDRETVQIQRVIETQAESFSKQIGESIGTRIRALERMGKRWEMHKGTPRREWEADVTLYETDYPGFHAIQWIDAKYKLRWSMPNLPQKLREHFKFDDGQDNPTVLRNAVARHETIITKPAELQDGSIGLLIYVPLYVDGQFNGFILGVHGIDEIFSGLASYMKAQNYSMAVVSAGKEVFRSHGGSFIANSPWKKEHLVQLENIIWRVFIEPRPEYLAKLHSGISKVVLIVGLLITVLAVLLIERALTARRGEGRFRESETRFRNLADAASDWFWEVDEKFICTWLSFDKHPISGAPASDILGYPGWGWPGVELQAPDGLNTELDALMNEHLPFRNFIIQAKYPGFETRDISLSGVPIFDSHDHFRGYRGACTDITRQKAIENQLRQAQKMEAVGQLTGGVAHDFNNLLAVTMSNAQMMELELDGSEELRSMAGAIVAASQRGAELTHRLLAFSRNQTLQPKALQLGALCEGMTSLLRRTLGETIAIEILIRNQPWSVMADPGEVESALLNLAINASHAMESGGKLSIMVENAPIADKDWAKRWEGRTGEFVALRVTDTGTGMTNDVLEHAFEPFFTTKEIGQGSGLGLSMVHGFAQQSGGFATLESQEGQGTSVTIYLPRIETDVASETVGAEPRHPNMGAGEIILLIEDEPAVRNATTNLLKMLGYEVVAAENGMEAIEIVSRIDQIDLLVSDIVLPGAMNGIEAFENIRRQRPDLRCLLMSGYASVSKFPLPDGAQLLMKPIELEQFSDKIRELLDLESGV